MPVPYRYNLKSLFYRKTATILTIVAVALTVGILVVLLSVSRGFSVSMATTGRTDNMVVLRTGATSEGESTLTRNEVNKLAGFSGIARAADGSSLFAPEFYAAINLPRLDGKTTNVPLRGVTPKSFEIRDGVRIAEGRMFRPGAREVLVGRGLATRIKGCRLGGSVSITKDPWEVVGIVDGGGTAMDSEIFGDVEPILQAFDRPFYNSFFFRVAEGADPKRLVELMDSIKIESEREYFTRQSGSLGAVITSLATFLTALMSVGALAGCTNTLLAAVAGRTREIGGLLAIGYRPLQIFFGFLVEAVALCLVGGVLGILATLWINGSQTGTTNFDTFTEQVFTFRVDETVVLAALALAVLIGLVGGAFPAWRASRLKPVDALRRG